MKKTKIITIIALLFFAFMVYQPITANAQWKQTAGKNWYYLDTKNKKVKSRWIGDYYLGTNGIMVKNKWISGKKGIKYFVGEDGKWIRNFNGGWQKIQNKWYFYSKSGKKQTGFITDKNNRYYCNKSGVMLTGLRKISNKLYYFKSDGKMAVGFNTVKGNRYYFTKSAGKGYALKGLRTLSKKIYYFDNNYVMQKGWQTVNGNRYYFNTSNGAGYIGWQNISGNQYYFSADAIMLTGLRNIAGKLYNFSTSGVMSRNTTIVISGKTYIVDSSGVCTEKVEKPSGGGQSGELLFFTEFESGLASYGQTGGDNGSACGRYQFDYRYSLLPLVKYCYGKDPVTFKEFKTYASASSGAVLYNNTKFYSAWRKIYARAPKTFASYQDSYAKQEYYDTVEYSLNANRINIKFRPDVVKGAVYSYSIQHGPGSAVNAVIKAGINNGTSDINIIKKLYKYRIKQFPLYKDRYTREMAKALAYLS